VQEEACSSEPVPRSPSLRRAGRRWVVSVRAPSRTPWSDAWLWRYGRLSAGLEDYLLLRRPRPQTRRSCEGRAGRRTPVHRGQRRRDGRRIYNRPSQGAKILELIHLGRNRNTVSNTELPPTRILM